MDQVAHQVEESGKKRGRQVPPVEMYPDFRLVTLKNLLTHHAGPMARSDDGGKTWTRIRDRLRRRLQEQWEDFRLSLDLFES